MTGTSQVLPIVEQDLRLTVQRRGTLHPWIGPALRGLAAARMKELVCRHPPAERRVRWQHCDGCPHQASCAYGRLFEPVPVELKLGAPVATAESATAAVDHPTKGAGTPRDGVRPCSLAPYFPLAGPVERGLDIPVKLLTVGQGTETDAVSLLVALGEAGGSGGLGPDQITFTVDADPPRMHSLDLGTLPRGPLDPGGSVPRVSVALLGPLFLTRRENTRRLPRLAPTLRDLLAAAIRTVTRLAEREGLPIAVDSSAFESAAAGIQASLTAWRRFDQERLSSRSGDRYRLTGVDGGAVFERVPWSMLPWLHWGGLLGVGDHRVAGAGRWRLVLD